MSSVGSSTSRLPWILVLGLIAVVVGVASATVMSYEPSGSPTLSFPSLASPIVAAPTLHGVAPVAGLISAPGGPYLFDRNGRVVFFHGVNVVYKRPPFEVYPDPGKPWNFGTSDASLMARLGFNVVRLGMTWRGLEPGTAPANDPTICSRGAPADPHQFNQTVLDRYLEHLRETVDLLGRFHIYTLLDMHQDVYNEMFDGEGAPNWAVCTNGVPSVDPPGRWSLEYGTAAAGIAYRHFWTNNVSGNLQSEYDRVWGAVAAFFKGNPWILGYDPFNEPFSTSLVTLGNEHFDAQLECFYTGAAYVGTPSHGAAPIRCPKNDPAVGVIPTILANDPNHLIFDEPDNFASRGFPTFIGPMNFPNLVFNLHIYCGYRDPYTGNPTNVALCAAQDERSLATRGEDRPDMASPSQPKGPAWFVSEFGATLSTGLIGSFAAKADTKLVGWAYWSWKYYDDPTGSGSEALVRTDGLLRSTARILSRAYPEAIAGTPVSMSFSPDSGAFHLTYKSNHAIARPTVIFVPLQVHYPHGYCARAFGARVISKPGSELLEVANSSSAMSVTISLTVGACALMEHGSHAGSVAAAGVNAERHGLPTSGGR